MSDLNGNPSSSRPEAKNNDEPTRQGPVLCEGGCQFYATKYPIGWYCSKCHREEKERREQDDAKAKVETAAMVAAAVEEEEIKPPKKKVQKKRHRCWSCKKKVGILGFECKCDYVFCSKHRYASAHDCDFDYKEANQNIIKKLNPQVKREKFERI